MNSNSPYNYPSPRLILASMKKCMQVMAELEWETFDEEEPLCPPVILGGGKRSCGTKQDQECKSPEAEEFEFRAWDGAGPETDMCAADEVFFKGQILPLRPSVSSDTSLFSSSRGSSKCGSRSDSMDRYSSIAASSISRSSSCISSVSRSHSATSFSSATTEPPRRSVSNNFYAQPSPSPQIISSAKKRNAAAKKAAAGSWWGLFRLGLVKIPEIELDGLKSRTAAAGEKANFREAGKEKMAPKFKGSGRFSCKCSPNSVDIVSSRMSIAKKPKSTTQQFMYHNRTFEWLEELSLAKEAEA